MSSPRRIMPFPEGVLAGAVNPQQIFEKASQYPREAAPLFEKGLVEAWYQINGWQYPEKASVRTGPGAMEKFLEAIRSATKRPLTSPRPVVKISSTTPVVIPPSSSQQDAAGQKQPPGPASWGFHLVPAVALVFALLLLFFRDLQQKEKQPPPPLLTPVKVTIETSGDDKDEQETPRTAIDPVPRIAYHYGHNRRFGVQTRPSDRGPPKRLTFSQDGQTNFGAIKINGKTEELGGGRGQWLVQEPEPDWTSERRDSKSVWRHRSNLQVTQVLDIVPSSQAVDLGSAVPKRLLDTCLVAYLIENKDSRLHRVGMRLEIDTLIGSNDGVPFTVPGLPGLVNTFREFDGNRVPEFIQALEVADLRNPGTVAHMSLKLGDGWEPPGRVSLTHWSAGFSGWQVPLRNMGTDSSIVLYWNEKDLPPGGKRTLAFSYGLGSVSSNEGKEPGKLGLTLSGSFEPGQEFTVLAIVTHPRPGQTLTLKLPPSLQRTLGEETQKVPVPAQNQNTLVTWRVRVQYPGRFLLEVNSNNGLHIRRTITITRPDPEVRRTRPDNIFR